MNKLKTLRRIQKAGTIINKMIDCDDSYCNAHLCEHFGNIFIWATLNSGVWLVFCKYFGDSKRLITDSPKRVW